MTSLNLARSVGYENRDLAFHPVELALAADEGLNEGNLLLRQASQGAGLEMPVDRRVALAAVQARHRQRVTAHRAVGQQGIHPGPPRRTTESIEG